MTQKIMRRAAPVIAALFALSAQAADKPNILFVVSDDTGYGDLGPYGGGVGRGMPTPNIDRMASRGYTAGEEAFPDERFRRSCPTALPSLPAGR